MKKFGRLRLLIFAVAIARLLCAPQTSAAQTASPFFYYYQGTRIALPVNPSLIAIRFQPGVNEARQRAVALAIGDVENFDARAQLGATNVSLVPLRVGADPVAIISKFKQRAEVLSAAPVFQFSDGAQFAETEEFIVRFKSTLSLSPAATATFNLSHGVEFIRAQDASPRVLILRPMIGNLRGARELANDYVESGWVDFAEPNFVIRQPRAPMLNLPGAVATCTGPSDSDFCSQWSLQNSQQFAGSQLGDDIKATQAWAVTRGASTLRIAIIDEGIDANHADLLGQVVSGVNETVQPPDTNTQPSGYDRHGTAVAGIAAAHTDNALGIAGVCWFCKIVPVKIAQADSTGAWSTTTTAMLAAGIDWAWQSGKGAADVLSNSWTMPAPSDDVTKAILNARFGGRNGLGSTIVFATGNSNLSSVDFPASLNSYVVAVGASNWCDQRKSTTNDACNNNDASWGSNYGTALDLLAPGQVIYTTQTVCNAGNCSRGYNWFSGTSASAPMVASAAALLYSLNPDLTPGQVQTALQNGAKDLGAAGRDDTSGYGRLDAYRSITALYDLNISASDAQMLVRPGDTLQYTINYSNLGMTAESSVVINATLPAGVDYVNSNPTFTANGGSSYTLNVGTVPANASGSATIMVQVQSGSAGQTLSFNAQISGAFAELNMSDNSATDRTGVVGTNIFLPFILR